MPTSTSRSSDSVRSGIFLLGLGTLLITGWWWPGVLLVIGAALTAERLVQGRFRSAGVVALVFIAVPVVFWLAGRVEVPGSWVAGFLLAAAGIVILVRALLPGTSAGGAPRRR
ncbi:MAG TPA: hypothetical protein VFP72_20610 [Kineosporiaceae bacterium]|nr:hypothetical protein [Kineosporiaceae bacterium]